MVGKPGRRSKSECRLALHASGKHDVEQLLAAVGLGLVRAVHAGRVSAGDASDLFFIDAFLSFSESTELDPKLLDALHEGSELEDVATIAPHGMAATLARMEAGFESAIRKRPAAQPPVRTRWVQRLPKRPK